MSRHRYRAIVVAVMIGLSLAAATVSFAAPAFAGDPAGNAGRAGSATSAAVQVDASRSAVTVGWSPFHRLGAAVSPACILVGKSCGMEGMCGENPCLCGPAVDRWGNCACNGTQTIHPTLFAGTSDGGIVRMVKIGRGFLLWPMGVGTTTVAIIGRLPNYADGRATVSVTVTAVGLVLFYLVVVLVIAAIAGMATLLVFAGRRRLRAWRSPRTRVGSESLAT